MLTQMPRVAFALLALSILGCHGDEEPPPIGEAEQAATFSTCEDECNECGALRCPSETRYHCEWKTHECGG